MNTMDQYPQNHRTLQVVVGQFERDPLHVLQLRTLTSELAGDASDGGSRDDEPLESVKHGGYN
jgi:hypothetical protein